MLHEPAAQSKSDPASSYKVSLGGWMFLVYALIYVGFVAINVSNPVLMEKVVSMGLNLAVVYGFGLIIFAIVLALIYNAMCTKKEKELEGKEENKENN